MTPITLNDNTVIWINPDQLTTVSKTHIRMADDNVYRTKHDYRIQFADVGDLSFGSVLQVSEINHPSEMYDENLLTELVVQEAEDSPVEPPV